MQRPDILTLTCQDNPGLVTQATPYLSKSLQHPRITAIYIGFVFDVFCS